MNTNRILLLATTAGLLLGGAAGFGQVTQALHGAVNATMALPQPPPMPPTNIGATAGLAGAAGAAAGVAGVNGAASGAMGAAAAIPNPPFGDVGVGVGVTAGAPGVAIGVDEKTDAWAALDFDGTMRRLNAVRLEERASLFDDLDARVKMSDKALAALRKHSGTFSAGAREDFDASFKDANAKEKALRRSEKEARRADAEHWANARADVSARYSAYAQAVHHAQVTAVAASSAKTGAGVRGAARTDADARANGSLAAGR